MKIWSTLALHTSVGCISLQSVAGPHFVTQPILLSENIPNIWHKSSTKHKEVRPDWNDKNDNANYAPSYHMEGFTNGSGCHFWKYSIKCEKISDCELFYSELKRHNVSHYIYYLATDNIHIVLENDNTVLIKGLKKVVNVKILKKHASYRNVYDGWNQRNHISAIQENLAKAGVFRWVTNIHEHKRYYYTFDNSLLFFEHSEHYTNLSTLNHNVRFLPCQHRALA